MGGGCLKAYKTVTMIRENNEVNNSDQWVVAARQQVHTKHMLSKLTVSRGFCL